MKRLLTLGAVLALVSPALAQPQGPRDVIEGARDQAEATRRDEAMGDTAPSGGPHDMTPAQQMRQTAADRMAGRTPPLAVATRDPSLPPGTIRVQVTDGTGQPASGVRVRVGIMRQAGARDAIFGETDAQGVALLQELATGSGQAYRVSVDHQGAKYGAPPFRLEADHGHSVRIRRLETSRRVEMVLQVLGQTMLEYREGRIHVTEQTQLTNLGDETVVFGDGLHYALPRGFMAFQSPAVMTDQRLVPDEEGFLLKGSIPPGTVTLNWAYDVPLDGGEAVVTHAMPFRTYAYRVFTDAAHGMDLEVAGFPAPQVVTQQGRRLLVTQLERRPEDAPFDQLTITVNGIPTAGPYRWVAAGAALMLFLLALLLVTRGGRAEAVRAAARERRKDEILSDAVDLSEAHARGEVGPKYHARRMNELVTELASLLRLDDASKALTATEKGDRS
ncbi:MAG: hypothetical protein CMN30_12410 [Sandaracinus sp.]|nr:hypothetical protein [Sandaracinus sp.]